MTRSTKVFVAGHRGLLGSALMRELERRGYSDLVVRTHKELDLQDQNATRDLIATERPDVIFLAAAQVGGIHANNTNRWGFLHWNLQIQNNVLGAALDNDVEKVVFFGSSCIYPKLAQQPIKEEYLLTGPLEPTNEPYAIAKIAGLKQVEAANTQFGRKWLSVMPTNLYGPNDNYDPMNSHVLPAMIRRFHEAKMQQAKGEDVEVVLWGSGKALREFLHVDDVARASLHLMEGGYTGLYNVGAGSELTIRELAELIARIVGFEGELKWDTTKSDGTPRKLMDSSRVRSTGWAPAIGLEEGIRSAYEWYRSQNTPMAAVAGG